jgi:glucose/arabinose dehydrogenase
MMFKATSHKARSPLLFISMLLLMMTETVWSATSCQNVSCSATCTPDMPAGVSTLMDSDDFPSGANIPIALVDPDDGRDRLLVATQEGAILVWDDTNQEMLSEFFLDLRDNTGGPVLNGGERGLLAMAVDPNYENSGFIYVFYTRADEGSGTTGDIVIERYTRSAENPDVAAPGSSLRIMVIDHPASNHNGGWLAFGPDQFLYISTGDGGSGCDSGEGASGDGQRSDTLAGKLLRIDVHGIDAKAGSPDNCGIEDTNYTVPSSNPYFEMEPACDEVWTLGLRNPFRFSFDSLNGDIYIGDVGQRKWEEINLLKASLPAPANFGWVCREGCQSASESPSSCSTSGCPTDTGSASCEFPRATGFSDPVLCHANSGGGWRSIISGYRYRGGAVPSLAGDYFYSDAACGQIWKTEALDPDNPADISSSCWASGFQGTFGFAEDRNGELYIIGGGSKQISCIHNGGGCSSITKNKVFDDGFEDQ